MVKKLSEHGVSSDDFASGLLADYEKSRQEYHMKQLEKLESKTHKEEDIQFQDIRYTLICHLFMISIADGFFDARSRSLLKSICTILHVPFVELEQIENGIADHLRVFDIIPNVTHEGEVVEKRGKLEGKNRWLMAGLATVAGGVVIGLTAGLAAPFIGAGIVSALTTFGVTGAGAVGVGTFVTGAGGLAVITTGGVLTGGGMSGVKMMKRTRAIEEFEFLGISDALEIIEKNQEERRKKWEIKTKKKTGTNNKEVPKSKSHDELVAANTLLWEMPASSKDLDTLEDKESLDAFFSTPNSTEVNSKQTHVLITIAGFVTMDRDDHTRPFSTIEQGSNGDQYSLIWETKVLKELGETLSILLGEVASFILQQGLQFTVLPVLMASLTAPMWAIKLTYLLDNPWGNALTKAEKAGRLLADTLIAQVQSSRPVTLVGFSVGARVIFYCLLELAAHDAFGLIEDVIMIGTPVISYKEDWKKIISVVSGRIVNGYASKDTLLSLLYRASNPLLNLVAGLTPAPSEFIENVDLSELINGHLDYYTNLPIILSHLGFLITSDKFIDQITEEDLFNANALAEETQAVESNTGTHETPITATAPTKVFNTEKVEFDEDFDDLMNEFWEPRELISTLPQLSICTEKLNT